MKNNLKTCILTGICSTTLLLSACNHAFMVYRADVQQGNVITPAMRQSVELGMTKREVVRVLGNPVLIDTFNNNRYNYVYSFRTGSGLKAHYKLTVVFRNGEVVRIIDGK